MATKKPRKESNKALLATVWKAMVRPRIAKSARQEVAKTTAPNIAETYP